MPILYDINRNLTTKANKPRREIRIEKMHVFDNPFRKAIKQLKEEYTRNQQPQQPRTDERWLQDSSQKFTLPPPKFT